VAFSIRSVATDRELAFVDLSEEGFVVELRGGGVAVRAEVAAQSEERGALDFFERLGQLVEPWTEAVSWESREGELRLSAACSRLGRVAISARISSPAGAADSWKLEASLATELGSLREIARSARAFFIGRAPN
jgi:hypothetical protein